MNNFNTLKSGGGQLSVKSGKLSKATERTVA